MYLQLNFESICSRKAGSWLIVAAILILTFSLPIQSRPATGSQDEIPAPPPLKVVPANELAELNQTHDLKNRMHLSLDFADGHLQNAEKYTTVSDYDAASVELGKYRAVVEEVLKYLDDQHDRSNRIRDSYKRVELALREQGPRIETIRRSTPREYAVNIKTLSDYTRDAREQALNSFYGDTVLREPKNDPRQRDSDHINGPTSLDNSKKP